MATSPSFIFGGNTGATQASLERRRRIADALAAQALDAGPKDIGQGIAQIGQALMARRADRRLNEDEARFNNDRVQSVAAALSAAQGGDFAPLLQHGAAYGDDALTSAIGIMGFQRQGEQFDKTFGLQERRFGHEVATDARDYERGVTESDRQFGLENDRFDFARATDARDYQRGVLESDRDFGLAQRGLDIDEARIAADMANERSVGQDALDRAFAGDVYVPFMTGGGADAMKGLAQLDTAISNLREGRASTGPIVGRVPDILKPESTNTREMVEEVVQRNLRTILGAQFTEREGERLISRAYNENLSPEINIARLERLKTQIQLGLEARQAAAEYFSRNGTLEGWTGRLPTMADFEAAIEARDGAREQTSRSRRRYNPATGELE